jgi:signal recognition particle subunit SRP54
MVLAELGGKLRDSLRRLPPQPTNEHVQQTLSDISRALIEADVNVKLVFTLRENIKRRVEQLPTDKKMTPRLIQRAVVDELTSLLHPNGDSSTPPFSLRRGQCNVICLVGLQGAGKTTTIAKLAQYYLKRKWKVAMVCADTFRAGALDQLKQNATKLRLPFYGSYQQVDPVVIAAKGVAQFRQSKYEIILVDTSGRHQQEAALLQEMTEIIQAVQPDTTLLVVDATQGQGVYDQAAAFHAAVPVGAVIVTKLDGHAKGGGALSAVAATQSSIAFTGTGEHFDDLDPFHAESFISQLLGFGNLRGLMEAMNPGGDDPKQSSKDMLEKMSKGEYTLRDMYQQFEKMLNMGPLNKIAGMIPGMPEGIMGGGNDEEQTYRLRRFMIIMDSMTEAELDGTVVWTEWRTDRVLQSRMRRIATGSGAHVMEVQMLLQSHRQFESMVGKLGKSAAAGAAGPKPQQLAAMMKKNPHFLQQRINQMDPRMLQSLGGRENALAMMQQFAKGDTGGMDFSAMMQQMQAGGVGGMMR